MSALWSHVTTIRKTCFSMPDHSTSLKRLAGTLDFGSSPFAEFDVSPVVFLYRHALELHLKTIVLGEGGNFLGMKPDPISISNSRSVSWLAQFVCQIVTAVSWEGQFTCDGVRTFA